MDQFRGELRAASFALVFPSLFSFTLWAIPCSRFPGAQRAGKNERKKQPTIKNEMKTCKVSHGLRCAAAA